jgi:hypothetical protein
MKAHLGLVGKREMQSKAASGGAVSSREHRIANPLAMFFQSVKQAPRSHELGRENAQSEKNGQPAGARCKDHNHAQCKERESEEDSYEPLGLLERL